MNGRWFDGRQIEALVFSSPFNENSKQQQDIDSFLAGIMQEEERQSISTVEPISVYTSAEAKIDNEDSNDNLDIDSFLEGSFLLNSF